jgi:BNR/Asp-box repeat protein
VEFLLTGQDVRCLAAHRTHPEVVYAGTQGNGVLRSNDGGRTWSAAGLEGQVVKALAVSPTFPDTVYAGTKPARLFVSHDAGAHWTELASFRHIPGRWFWFSPAEKPYSAYVQAIALSPTHPQIIVVGIEAGAVVRSTDGGQTWSGHRSGALRDCHSLTFHVSNGDWVYEVGGSGAGVCVSRDAGATWTQPKDGLDRHYGWAGAADPIHPEIWYASVSSSAWKAHSEYHAQAVIVRSMGGAAWQRLTGGLPQPLNAMPYALLTDPTAPGHVYAGLSNGEVWHSTDYGDTWRQLPVHFENIQRTLLLLP